MKVLIGSGGGSHGMYGVAKAERLYSNDYDVFIGWSTMALQMALIAIGELFLLKWVYMNTTQSMVFNVDPFNKNGKINYWNAFKRTVQGKPTLGETKALKALIDKHYTHRHFELLQKSGKEVIIACSSLEHKDLKVIYFSSKECDFETFKMAMWASASPLLYGDIVDINGKQYTDAGAVEILSYNKAIEIGATHIDAIIHRTKFKEEKYITKVTRVWDFLGRLSPAITGGIINDKIEDGAELARAKGITVNEHYMPFEPDFTSFVFNPEKMTRFYYDLQKYILN